MSGVSLAVAPQDEVDRATSADQRTLINHPQQQSRAVGTVLGSLRVIELQLVAFIMVFSASGLVPLLDLVFPAFTSAYLLALSRFVFPSHGKSSSSSQEIFQGSKLFRFYVVVGTTVGLFLPLAYVLGAPVRALVPLLYTVRRLFLIIDGISGVWFSRTLPVTAEPKDMAWFWFRRALAVANLVYFSANLFCFLIPRFLPLAFEKYFREREEIQGKYAEDKRSTSANKSQPTDKKTD